MTTFTGKQALNLGMYRWPETIVIEDGAIRSGKSMSIAYGFLRFMHEFRPGTRFLIAAPEVTQIKEVQLAYIEQACNELGVYYEGHKATRKTLKVGPYIIHTQNARQVGNDAAIKGLSFGGTWIDEAAECDPAFIKTVIGRHLVKDITPKIILSCNPKGARHWLKKDYIDKAGINPDIKRIQFELADNPTMDDKFIRMVKSTLTGAALQRDVFGQWVDEEGLIYPNVIPVELKDLPLPVARYFLAVDYATSSVTSALLIGGYEDGTFAVLDEWRHDARKALTGELTSEEQADRILSWVGDRTLKSVVIDPSAAPLRVAIKRVFTGVPILKGKNDVVPGIQLTKALLANGTLKIASNCKDVLDEIGQYSWDEKAAEKGEDKPIKMNDHACDALRYFCTTIRRRRARAA